jgi:hypothetical protein
MRFLVVLRLLVTQKARLVEDVENTRDVAVEEVRDEVVLQLMLCRETTAVPSLKVSLATCLSKKYQG